MLEVLFNKTVASKQDETIMRLSNVMPLDVLNWYQICVSRPKDQGKPLKALVTVIKY